MKEIQLSQTSKKNKDKFVALVDDNLFEHLNQWKWQVMKSKKKYYAGRRTWNPATLIMLHRYIMDTPAEMEVDHINGNSLDCQKHNMRNCTHADNCRNTTKAKGFSKYIGVSRYGKDKFCSSIRLDGKAVHLGVFANEIEAAKAHDNAVKKHYGEFAGLNFK